MSQSQCSQHHEPSAPRRSATPPSVDAGPGRPPPAKTTHATHIEQQTLLVPTQKENQLSRAAPRPLRVRTGHGRGGGPWWQRAKPTTQPVSAAPARPQDW